MRILAPRTCWGRAALGRFKPQRSVPPHVWGQCCRKQRSDKQIYRDTYLSSAEVENGFGMGKREKTKRWAEVLCGLLWPGSISQVTGPFIPTTPLATTAFLISCMGSVMVFLQWRVQITTEQIRLQSCFSFQQLLLLVNFSIYQLCGRSTWWYVSNSTLFETERFPTAGFSPRQLTSLTGINYILMLPKKEEKMKEIEVIDSTVMISRTRRN